MATGIRLRRATFRAIGRVVTEGFCVPELQTVQDGETVMVTVTAQYATGPWLAELASEWQDPSAQG
jgi:hypothetical protein